MSFDDNWLCSAQPLTASIFFLILQFTPLQVSPLLFALLFLSLSQRALPYLLLKSHTVCSLQLFDFPILFATTERPRKKTKKSRKLYVNLSEAFCPKRVLKKQTGYTLDFTVRKRKTIPPILNFFFWCFISSRQLLVRYNYIALRVFSHASAVAFFFSEHNIQSRKVASHHSSAL